MIKEAVRLNAKSLSNEQITVLYGDTDSKPMYISYTGYKTEKEAEDAFELIAKNKDRYINALMIRKVI